MRILHVIESFGGGVTSAINTYVKNSGQFEHYLFASVRALDSTGEESTGTFVKVEVVKRSLKSLLMLKKFVDDVKPDAIHLHSTYAGFFVRLLPWITNYPTIYTPHGFSFLRDDNFLLRKAYYLVEKILCSRTTIIAGCGQDEANIAKALSASVATFPLINVCDPLKITAEKEKHGSLLTIGMVGRVTAQKGYSYFAEVAAALKGKAKFKWIGGGESAAVSELESAGVEVSGWLSRTAVIEQLQEFDVYFHTAAWDGFPISVLEAAEINLPIVLREIGPFSAENLFTLKDLNSAVTEVRLLIDDSESVWRKARENQRMISRYHSVENLQTALDQLYKEAVAR